MVKAIYWIQHTKKIKADKNWDKDGKALYILMNNAIYGKTMKSLRNRISVKLVNNGKEYLKCTSKPNYMSHKIFDINFVAIRKSIIALTLNNSAYIEMCILDLRKGLMHRFHYAYIKNEDS